MQLYIMYCELEEFASDCDSFNYFCIKYTNTNNLIKDFRKSWGTSSDFSDIITDVDCPVQVFTQHSYNALSNKLKEFKNYDIDIYTLSSFLKLPEDWNLYEIFSYYFDSGNSIISDKKMVEVIATSLLVHSQFSYCVFLQDENKYSFSWFYIDNRSNIVILGNDSLTLSNSDSKGFMLGKFMKSLRYKMALSGCCLEMIKFITWNKSSLSYISDYLTFNDLFSKIEGLSYLDYNSTIKSLSTDFKFDYTYSADEFVKTLSQSSRSLGLKSLDTGELACNDIFQKDYSICTSSSIDKSRGKWGIILDCEGNKNNQSGLRELGGIIFCRYKNILISVETFECTEILLEETLQQTIKNYEVLTDRYIPSRGIDIYVFGSSDDIMIENSLRAVGTKQFRRRVKKIFKYHDCRDYIYSYIGNSLDDKKTLSNVAKYLGVKVVSPKHSGLADSRTLFNVLSYILKETEVWVNN